MTLSIIIPVFNEDNTIEKIIFEILNIKLINNIIKEIIIIDDASTDKTKKILKKFENNNYIKIIYHKKNKGKGAAIKTGLNESTGDLIIFQDADLEYNPNDYNILLKKILKNKFDVVYGSRFLKKSHYKGLALIIFFANKILTVISNCLSGLKLSDMETCYKLFKKEILNKIIIKENGFGIEPEITAKMAKLVNKDNCRICEVPIKYSPRNYKEGKKIGIKDGIKALYCIIKYNLKKSL